MAGKSKKPKGQTKTKIKFSELVARVQSGKITEDDCRRYFHAVYEGTEPFKPSLGLRESEVDLTGIRRTARAAGAELGFEASEVVRQGRMAATHLKKAAGKAGAAMGAAAPIAIVAEGDSWFNLPALFFPDTLIDKLSANRPIHNIAMWGDELDEMIAAGEYLPALLQGGIRFLLFSGGGNDALGGGDLSSFLDQRVSGDNDPANASRYIRPEFFDVLDDAEILYAQLANNVLSASPETYLVLHGYDYAIPRTGGPWLGREMALRGFHPKDNKVISRAVIRLMIDAFNDRLRTLHNNMQNVIYLDLRGTIPVSGWFDELHGKSASAQKLAAKYASLLNKANPKPGPIPIV